jgi:hypothetical protein
MSNREIKFLSGLLFALLDEISNQDFSSIKEDEYGKMSGQAQREMLRGIAIALNILK